jgi:hypothetical protein
VVQTDVLSVAAEVATLREAVKTVREAAEALQMASDEAQKPMQRLNLREARSILVSCLIVQLQHVYRSRDGRLCAGFLELQAHVGAGTAAGTAQPSMLWWRWLRCCFRGHNAADITGYNVGVTVTPHGHAPLQYLHQDELHSLGLNHGPSQQCRKLVAHPSNAAFTAMAHQM